MKLDYKNTKRPIPEKGIELKENFSYPPNEDVYAQFKEESEIDPENPSQLKETGEELGAWNEKTFDED